MKSVLPNLGFVLQTTGLATLLAAPVAAIYSEQVPLISILTTALAFLVTGFLLNAFSRRRTLDFRLSCLMVIMAYSLIGVLGAVPYVYTNAFSDAAIGDRLVNGIFESISGYTTTGFTVATSLDSLPRSIVFYRALTQWIGGINIVFIFLFFFYSNRTAEEVGRAVGLNHVTATMRKSYLRVVLIYTLYTILFVGVFFALGLRDPVNTISLVFSGLSTGGFLPVNDLSGLSPPVYGGFIVLMVAGATSFSIHYGFFSRKFEKIMIIEFLAMITFITVAFGITVGTGPSPLEVLFHVTSASSTTGFSFINFESMNESAKILFVILMFAGGSAFSTAGGVKMIRVLVFFAAIPWAIKSVIKGQLEQFTFQGKEFRPADILSWWLILLLGGFSIVLFSLILSFNGYPFLNSIFEITSALSNTGLSTGIASGVPDGLKILFMLAMVLGRVEIITVLIALMPFARRVRVAQPAPELIPSSQS